MSSASGGRSAEARATSNQRDKFAPRGTMEATSRGPREAKAIIRYGASLDRTIRHATSELQALRNMRLAADRVSRKCKKRCEYRRNSVLRLGEGPRTPLSADLKVQKQPTSRHREKWSEAAEGPQVPPLE